MAPPRASPARREKAAAAQMKLVPPLSWIVWPVI
jgi:hypothetical protein